MFAKKLSGTDLLLIAVNLVPLYGVWFGGWDAVSVFIVYCLETVIAGLANVVKLVLTTLFNREAQSITDRRQTNPASGLFVTVFFIIHYGFFVCVQTQIFMNVSSIGTNGFFNGYGAMMGRLGDEGKLLLLIFTAWYTIDLIKNFILSGKYRNTPLTTVMFQPYGRVFVQQLIVIVGSLFLTFNLPKVFIVVFVAVKLFAELCLPGYFYARLKEAAAKEKFRGSEGPGTLP